MRYLLVGAILFGIFSAQAQTDTKATSRVTKAVNQFAFDLYKINSKKPGNLFFSPLSIETALSMTSVGAREETLAEMQKTLGLAGIADKEFKDVLDKIKGNDKFELFVANRLWGQQGFSYDTQFLKTVRENYAADLEPLDFKKATEPSREKINQWIEEKTKQKIKNMLAPGAITPETDLVLTNAIYFKSQWSTQFEKNLTKLDKFFISGSNTKKVSFMTDTNRYYYSEDDQMQIIEIPYKGNDLTMTILLPKKDVSMAQTETVEVLKKLPNMRMQNVELSLPKFKIESQFELAQDLSKLGMPSAFDQKKANFKGIRKLNPGENISISNVIHKAFVEVDEEGTEAAAATAVIMMTSQAIRQPEKPQVFKADHPFLFLIRHRETGAILFMGRVSEP